MDPFCYQNNFGGVSTIIRRFHAFSANFDILGPKFDFCVFLMKFKSKYVCEHLSYENDKGIYKKFFKILKLVFGIPKKNPGRKTTKINQ